MLPDIAERYHKQRDIRNFGGLHTAFDDYRAARPGLFRYCMDGVCDDLGNWRPRDGYERWWPIIPQRVTLGRFELDESWALTTTGTGQAAISTAEAYAGFRSLKLSASGAGAFTATGTLTASTALSVLGDVVTTDVGVYAWVKPTAGQAAVSSLSAVLTWGASSQTLTASISDLPTAVWSLVRLGSFSMPDADLATVAVTLSGTATTGQVPSVYVDDLHARLEMAGTGNAFAQVSGPTAVVSTPAFDGVWIGSNTRTATTLPSGQTYKAPIADQHFDNYGAFVESALMPRYAGGPMEATTVDLGTWATRGVVSAHVFGYDMYVLVAGIGESAPTAGQSLSGFAIVRCPEGSFYGAADPRTPQFWSASLVSEDISGDLVGVTDFALTSSGDLLLTGYGPNGAIGMRFTPDGSGGWAKVGPAVSLTAISTARAYITIDAADQIYISLANGAASRVAAYANADWFSLPAWNISTIGSGNGQINNPAKLLLQNSILYVVDAGNYRVQRLNASTGAYIGQFGSYGSAPGQFLQPFDIAIFSGGILVTDMLRNDVQQYTQLGVYMSRFAPTYAYAQDSFGLGGHEFAPVGSADRFLLAGFGDCLYVDRNELRTPYLVRDKLTRNAALYFGSLPYAAVVCNGNDVPFLFTQGGKVRAMGFTPPTTLSLTLTPASGGAMTTSGTYYYGVSFVYGEGALRHGESNVTPFGTAGVLTSSNQSMAISGIPTADVSAMVVARRIYRCVAGAGPLASKYFVHELSDNTTTTYTDTLSDADLVLFSEAPTDNGLPPVAQYCCYYNQGMLLAQGATIYWSRPGVNLNETPETFPGDNYQVFPTRITGMAVFNNNVYIGTETQIYAGQWSGSALVFRPVEGSVAARLGVSDQRAMTVWGNQYLIFKEASTGQLRSMLSNESFPEPLSNGVYPLFNDSNPYPTSTTVYYDITGVKAQLDLGTCGANLHVSDAGELYYQYGNVLSDTTLRTCTLSAQQTTTIGARRGTGERAIILKAVNETVASTIQCGKPVRIDAVKVGAFVSQVNTGHYDGATISIRAAISDQAGKLLSLSNTVEYTFLAPGPVEVDEVFAFTSPIYVAQGQTLTVTLECVAASASDKILFNVYAHSGVSWQKDAFTYSEATPGFRDHGPVAYGLLYADVQDTRIDLAVLDGGAGLQRWAYATMDGTVRGGSRIYLDAAASASATDYSTGDLRGMYNLLAIADVPGLLEPVWSAPSVLATAYPLRDYRNGDVVNLPYSANSGIGGMSADPQRRYFYLRVFLWPGRTVTTIARASTVYADVFPQVTAINVFYSSEAAPGTAYTAPYNPLLYADDIYTSEVKNPGSIGRLGRLYVSQTIGQQDTTFQIRTGTDGTDILTRSWVTVNPNEVIPTQVLVTGATVYQWRVVFQDNPQKEGYAVLEPTVIRQVAVSYSPATSLIAPKCPPAIVAFNEQLVGSWCAEAASTPDHTFWMDFAIAADGSKTPRFSSWSGKHFSAFILANRKCFGMPASGGALYRMFNSAIGDAPERWPDTALGTPAVFVTQPHILGTPNLKTMMGLYIGLELNFHKGGFNAGQLSQYAAATDGELSSTPAFVWSIGANPDADNVSVSAGISTLNSVVSSKNYQELLTHAALGYNQGNSYRPFAAEYFFDVGLCERAFFFGIRMQPFKDAAGRSVFPTLTNVTPEYSVETLRGV